MCCLNSDKIGRASRASPQVPLYSVLPQIRSPKKTSLPLSTGPGTVSAYPWIVGFNFLPAYRTIQTSQSHRLWEPGSTSLPSQYIQRLPPTVPGSSFCPKWNPHVVLHGMWCPPRQAWLYVTNKLLSISSVQCWVLCWAILNPRVGISPSPTGWIVGY